VLYRKIGKLSIVSPVHTLLARTSLFFFFRGFEALFVCIAVGDHNLGSMNGSLSGYILLVAYSGKLFSPVRFRVSYGNDFPKHGPKAIDCTPQIWTFVCLLRAQASVHIIILERLRAKPLCKAIDYKPHSASLCAFYDHVSA